MTTVWSPVFARILLWFWEFRVVPYKTARVRRLRIFIISLKWTNRDVRCLRHWRDDVTSREAEKRQCFWMRRSSKTGWIYSRHPHKCSKNHNLAFRNGSSCRTSGPTDGQRRPGRTDGSLRTQHWHRRAGVGKYHKETPRRRNEPDAASTLALDVLAGQVSPVPSVFGC